MIVDPDFEELIPSFLKKTEAGIAEMEETVQKGDLGAAKAQAHKLKGSFSVYGFPAMSVICAEVESLVKTENRETAIKEIARLKNHFVNLKVEYK